jgi:general secretion pathway protein D
MMSSISRVIVPGLFVALVLGAEPARAQQPTAQTSRVTVTFEGSTIQDALAFFARYSGRSIVMGTGVTGVVSAQISDQPWDVALAALLSANGLFARELESGIIVVERAAAPIETPGRLVSRVFRLNYQPAAEIEPVIRSMLTARGTVAVVNSINALVVTDEERVLQQVANILGQI